MSDNTNMGSANVTNDSELEKKAIVLEEDEEFEEDEWILEEDETFKEDMTVEELEAKAERYKKARKFKEAGSTFYKIGRKFRDEEDHIAAAEAFNKAGEMCEEIRDFVEAAMMYGEEAGMYGEEAGMYGEERGARRRAAEMYRKVAGMYGKEAGARRRAAETLEKKGDPKAAAMMYGEAAEMCRKAADMYEQGEFELAEGTLWDKAAMMYGEAADMYVKEVEVLIEAGEFELAWSALIKAIEALKRAGKPKAAEIAFRKAEIIEDQIANKKLREKNKALGNCDNALSNSNIIVVGQSSISCRTI